MGLLMLLRYATQYRPASGRAGRDFSTTRIGSVVLKDIICMPAAWSMRSALLVVAESLQNVPTLRIVRVGRGEKNWPRQAATRKWASTFFRKSSQTRKGWWIYGRCRSLKNTR